MNPDTRAERDHIEGTVRRVLLQYAHLKTLLDTGASAVKFDAIGGVGEQIIRCWVQTVGVILANVDRAMNVRGASRAAAQRLCMNTRWLDIADDLTVSIDGAKEVVTAATARLYLEIVVRGISEDYRAAA